ncbi:MAG: cytochrome c [Thermodesulfobacteriota bacterium]
MKIIIILLVLGIVLVLCGLVFINSGLFDVAATKPEAEIVKWVLQTTKEKSVRSRAKDITVPNLNDESFLEIGFSNYDQMCVGCHGAPGISPSVIGEGLNPEPPDLSEVASHMPPEELFWITQNGIKMTGMPAFGPTHSDEELWAMVAFMQELPDLSAEKYKAMKEESEKMPQEHNHGSHSH